MSAPADLDAFFAPRRIAVVGASDRIGSAGRVLWDNLATFPGELVAVRRSGAPIDGTPTHPSLAAVPGPVDLVVAAVPAGEVPALAASAGERGDGGLLIVSGGFAETGDAGRALEEQLRRTAAETGLRIVGPNGLGVQNCDLPLNASLSSGLPRGGGGISLVTQSGAYAMMLHTIAIEERARFAKMCSIGNQVDVGSAELLDHLANDPATRVVGFFLESLPDARAFLEAARRAPIPVVVARTGRSAAGERAIASHTGALAAGDLRVERELLTEAGVILARTGLELLDVARALSEQPAPRGRRVGVITNSGGVGVELVDLLVEAGATVPALSLTTRARLGTELPAHGSAANPVDITTVWSRFASLYPTVLDVLARSDELDAIVVVLVQRAAADAGVADGLVRTVAALRREGVSIPVHVCWMAPRDARANADRLQEAGVPCFEGPERTARAVGLSMGVARTGADAQRPATHPSNRDGAPDATERARTRWLDVGEAADLLREAGVPLADSAMCRSAAEAVDAGGRLGFPVVAKLVQPGVVHRTEADGVRLGLRDPRELTAAAEELLARDPAARVLVQGQCQGHELVVGGLRDERLGPVVMIGAGGLEVEHRADVTFLAAPLTLATARRAWQRLAISVLLGGVRGRPPVDLEPLCRCAVAVGDLLIGRDEVLAVDLNPVMAAPEGTVAVDWRILTRLPGQEEGSR